MQYGSDEFAHDSPRYTSPTGGTSYYLQPDGTPGTVGDWPASYGTPYQAYDAYGLTETEGQGLPPMSSFRANGTPVTTAAAPNNAAFGPGNHTDGLNKALGAVCTLLIKVWCRFNRRRLQIYPIAEQASASSYSSAPSTPVSSPPPLASAGWLANHNNPHSPHYTQAVNNGSSAQGLHMVNIRFFPSSFFCCNSCFLEVCFIEYLIASVGFAFLICPNERKTF